MKDVFLYKDVNFSLFSGLNLQILLSHMSCKEEYLLDKKEYNLSSMEGKTRYELPYIYSDLTLNEMINLNKEFIQGGKIKLKEPSTGTKDKYVTIAMANLFVRDVLEVKLSGKTKHIDKKRMLRFRQPKVFG